MILFKHKTAKHKTAGNINNWIGPKAKKRNSSLKQENRELSVGARQSEADSELALEQLTEGQRNYGCVDSDGNPAV